MRKLFNMSFGVLVAIQVILAATVAAADTDTNLTVELNKFETADSGECRAFFLFRNQTGKSFEEFEMSLAILDGNGVIDRLLTIDAAPLPISRTTLKLFEIPGISCDGISEILLHAIDKCRPQNEDQIDCFPIINLVSRTPAQLVQ